MKNFFKKVEDTSVKCYLCEPNKYKFEPDGIVPICKEHLFRHEEHNKWYWEMVDRFYQEREEAILKAEMAWHKLLIKEIAKSYKKGLRDSKKN